MRSMVKRIGGSPSKFCRPASSRFCSRRQPWSGMWRNGSNNYVVLVYDRSAGPIRHTCERRGMPTMDVAPEDLPKLIQQASSALQAGQFAAAEAAAHDALAQRPDDLGMLHVLGI